MRNRKNGPRGGGGDPLLLTLLWLPQSNPELPSSTVLPSSSRPISTLFTRYLVLVDFPLFFSSSESILHGVRRHVRPSDLLRTWPVLIDPRSQSERVRVSDRRSSNRSFTGRSRPCTTVSPRVVTPTTHDSRMKRGSSSRVNFSWELDECTSWRVIGTTHGPEGHDSLLRRKSGRTLKSWLALRFRLSFHL